jgi:hypothetical protein
MEILFIIILVAVFFLIYYIININQPIKTIPMPVRITTTPIPMSITTTPMPTLTLKDKFRQMWKNEGCTTEPVWNDWYEKQNEETLKKDATYWANLTDDYHRSGCYGLDKSKWPTV